MRTLPQIFDFIGILAEDERFQVLFNGRDHRVRLEMIARRADTVQAGFAGFDLDESPTVAASAAGRDYLDAGNLERGKTGGPLSALLRGGGRHRG